MKTKEQALYDAVLYLIDTTEQIARDLHREPGGEPSQWSLNLGEQLEEHRAELREAFTLGVEL